MTRKSKPAVEKPAHIKPPSTDKKRKIDWSTVEDFDGFQVKSASVKKARKKQKTGAQASEVHYPGRDVPLKAEIVQANPFPGAELSAVHMKIEPAQYWESTNRYKKFTSKSQSQSRVRPVSQSQHRVREYYGYMHRDISSSF
jgi:hypothetical protein